MNRARAYVRRIVLFIPFLVLLLVSVRIGSAAVSVSHPLQYSVLARNASGSDCLQLDSASWTSSEISQPRKIMLNLVVLDSDKIKNAPFQVEWQPPEGKPQPLLNVISKRSKPIEVTYLLDLDKTLLHVGDALGTEKARSDERSFWQDVANLLVTQLDLSGAEPTDKAVVHTAQSSASHAVGAALCTQPTLTSYQDGVVSCLLDAVQYNYNEQQSPIDAEKEKIPGLLVRDEWPNGGRKAIVILRWRDSLPDGSMYGIPSDLEKTTFVFVLGRSADPPPGWDEAVVGWKRHKYQVTYILAPPAYQVDQRTALRLLDNALRRMANQLEVQRQGLDIDVDFPIILDSEAATSGELVIRQEGCSLGVGLSEIKSDQGKELPQPHLVVWLWITLASILLVVATVLLCGAIFFKMKDDVRKEVEGWKWGGK
jgi:hypothetical protein